LILVPSFVPGACTELSAKSQSPISGCTRLHRFTASSTISCSCRVYGSRFADLLSQEGEAIEVHYLAKVSLVESSLLGRLGTLFLPSGILDCHGSHRSKIFDQIWCHDINTGTFEYCRLLNRLNSYLFLSKG
jgi:hypothetical protein